MLSENLVMLRNLKGLTQEQVAEVVEISRQSYAKWEQGETVPDIEKCDRLASFYGIKLDALMHYDEKVGNTKMAPPPEGKFLWGTVKLGNRGQIVIPKEARDKYGLQEGSRLVVLGDEEGIALIQAEKFESQLNGLGMLFLKLLTNRAQIFADVRTYWSPQAVKKATGYEVEGVAKEAGGFIHLINSGAACLDASGQARDAEGNSVMKPWYEVTEEDQKAMLEATTWSEADFGYFRGGGYSSRFVTEAQMPVTMIRLNLVKGVGPTLQIAEGWTVKLPEDVTDVLWKRTDYTWPCTWFAPRCNGKEGPFKSAYDVMNNWGANHGAISYGHVGADLITLCSMLRIPVSMHNVPEEKIFRPASWNAFGMDKEGQDYRACAAYGPMYR